MLARVLIGILLASLIFPGQALSQRFPNRLVHPAIAAEADAFGLYFQQSASCPGRRAGTVALHTVGSAALGWVFFTFGVGALASDHGAVYRSERRRWVLGAATVGFAIGSFKAVTRPCHRLP